jgi:hypothetical protein
MRRLRQGHDANRAVDFVVDCHWVPPVVGSRVMAVDRRALLDTWPILSSSNCHPYVPIARVWLSCLKPMLDAT